ncbi:MAG: diguanylate cyclase [Planctomycetia bacterium]|nr:MAG: diguanylate cyclase [Planctomycetia bacterium]
MAGTLTVLVVGDVPLRDASTRALPGAVAEHCTDLLSGVLQAGRVRASHIILSAEADGDLAPAVAAIRKIAPHARIVAACPPRLEPRVRLARRHGIDDYVVTPIADEELRRALRWSTPEEAGASHPPPPPSPSPADREAWQRLTHVLNQIGGSNGGLIEGWAHWLRGVARASGATVEWNGCAVRTGESDPIRVERLIQRGVEVVGRIVLDFPQLDAAAAREAETCAADWVAVILAGMAAHDDLAAWRRLALTDELTGLHNRRFFERELDALLETAIERRQRATLLLFDIDDFKRYNDALGHDVGDALLREIAMLLMRCSRREDIVCRYGGDEFAVVFRDSPEPRVVGSGHPTAADALHERFLRAIAEHSFRCLGPSAPATVTVSGGLAGFPWDGRTRSELVRAADAALMRAKAAGRNRIVLAGPDAADPGGPG